MNDRVRHRPWGGRLAPLALGCCALTSAQETAPSEPLDETKPLVVMIEGELDEAPAVGAGLIFGRDAKQFYVVTANHVVRRGGREAQRVRVLLHGAPGHWIDARLTPDADAAPQGQDLAVLAVPGLQQNGSNLCDLAVARLGDPSAIKRGAAVYPMGYPQGRIQWGSPITPQLVAQVAGTEIQFESSTIIGGYSGGPLLSRSGKVLGLIRSHDPPFAIATRIDTVLNVLRKWKYPVELRLTDSTPPLFAAAEKKDAGEVERLLKSACPNVDERHEGQTALIEAAGNGAAGIVRALLRAGAQPSARIENPEYKDWTPLQAAANRGHTEVVKVLLETGVGTESSGPRYSATPLELAVRSGHSEVVKVLRGAGAKTDFVRTPNLLLEAAGEGQLEPARLLLELKANVNAPDRNGRTPLLAAVEGGHVEMLRLLLAAGANPNAKKGDESPLGSVIVQCWHDDENVVRRMPSKEPDLLKIAELLVRAGARLDNVKGTGESRETAIGLATHYGQVDVVKLLIRAGANVNLGNGKGRTALHVAAEKFARDDLINFDAEMQLQLLQVLLAGGADINGKDDKGDPPLCRALHGSPANPRIKIVEILLKAGAKPLLMEQCRGQDGRAWAPNESINQLLRSYGAK